MGQKDRRYMSSASSATARNTTLVRLDNEVFKVVKEYSNITGVPMSRVLLTALTDWMGTVGTARIESMNHNRAKIGEVVQFPKTN